VIDPLRYPFDASAILLKKKAIKRTLLDTDRSFLEKRVAILGGSTTAEIRDTLELFLLKEGIKPAFYESEYNKFYEDVMFDNPKLLSFKPDIVYIHTTTANLHAFPSVGETLESVEKRVRDEVDKYQAMWNKLSQLFNCAIIQNNFELPPYRPLANSDSWRTYGKTFFIYQLNGEWSRQARERKNFYINDIHYLSALLGLKHWHDRKQWYSYKYALSYDAIPTLAHNIASLIKSIYGKNKKVLVLDLDNTLWGGEIGENGPAGIEIGKETPLAEAHTEFQDYARELRRLGVLLAVCSKNDEGAAKEGFSHPDSVLTLEDFSAFKANWQTKPENLEAIAQELNVGLDSCVFVDDNPAERELVSKQLPSIETPEIGGDVTDYVNILDRSHYFEPLDLSEEDLKRSAFYAENSKRENLQKQFASYNDYLASLEMEAEIGDFSPVYLDRITQLINKTNQFNLTTKRYTYAEVEAMSRQSDRFSCLYGRLKDKFGDNGLVSVIIGRMQEKQMHVDVWLMSCRVLQRNMEQAMFHVLLEEARRRSATELVGSYHKTPKNGMVSDFYQRLGWKYKSTNAAGDSEWRWTVNTDTPLTKSLPITIVRASLQTK